MRGWGICHHAACLSAASSCLLPLLLLLLLHSVCSPNHVQQSEAEVHVVNSVSQCTSTAVVQYSCRSTAVYSVAEFVEQYSVAEFASAMICLNSPEDSDTAVLYFCLSCSVQSAELAGIRSAGSNPVSSIRSGRILRSCWHRFQSVYVFWHGRMFSRQQKFRFGSRSWIPACCWLLG